MTKFFITTLVITTFYFNGLSQTKKDSLAIEQACKDYVEGWASGDETRIIRGVSPELEKRSIGDNNGSFTFNLSYSGLLSAARRNANGVQVKDLEPDKELIVEVDIYDISGDFASAKTLNTKYGFFDYCHLAKFDGEWKVFNVLWGWIPKE